MDMSAVGSGPVDSMDMGSAELVTWIAGEESLGNGIKPAVAVGSSAAFAGDWKIEVDQGDSTTLPQTLWYRSGIGSSLAAPAYYQQGYCPALASWSFDNLRNVLEVHQAQDGATGPLWFMWGTLTGVAGNQMSWSASQLYDNGIHPSVAALDSAAVEVHQAGLGSGPLWYRTGQQPAGSGAGTAAFTWFSSAGYDNGVNPAVTMTRTLDGIQVVEVHQAQDGLGPLWYRTGTVATNLTRINWNDSFLYDSGVNPSVTAFGSVVLEVHQAADGTGPLWYRTGVLQGTGILWNPAQQYAIGAFPKLAQNAGSGIEIHLASAKVPAALSQRRFVFNH
jgi:hypothetical protein